MESLLSVRDNDSEELSTTSSMQLADTKLYKTRWLMTALFSLQCIVVRIQMTSIGVINDVYNVYFNLSSYVIDWFTLIQIPAMIFSSFLLAIFTFNSIVDSRKLFILMSLCVILSCLCSMIAFAFPHLYGSIFLGQFAVGFGSEASHAMISSLAINWFPENQIGLALSFKSVSLSLGCFMGFLIPSQTFSSEPHAKVTNFSDKSQLQNTNTSITQFHAEWKNEIRFKFLILYGCQLVICVIIWLLGVIFVVDKPPKPPTISQALKVQEK